MVTENNTREVVEDDFRENLKGLLKNFFDKEWRENYGVPSLLRINELGKEEGSVDGVVSNLAMLGMSYVTLLMNEVLDSAAKDMEGNGGET